MKKTEIVTLGKEKYNLNSNTINQVLEFVFNLNKEKIFLLNEIDDIYLGQIMFIFEKLHGGYPLAYIIKKCNFMGEDYYVDENVLIPRDDTEVLVNAVIREDELTQYILIDIGTGSGIIPISLAKKIEFESIYAIDISDGAVKVAKENAFRHFLEDKIIILNTDFKKFEFELFRGKNLIVTANLPYIKEGDYENMDLSVYKFEPKTALYGGRETGFELYEELIDILIEKRQLFDSIVLFIEIGFDQYEISKRSLEEKGLKFEFFKDTNNISRVIKIVL